MRILYLLLALAGAVLMLLRNRRRLLLVFCLFFLPVLTMIPFNLLGFWPFGPLRMNLFLMAYIVVPSLIPFDEWQRSRTRSDGFQPVWLIIALLVIVQFPVDFGRYAAQRPVLQKSGEALVNLVEYAPERPPIPLLINRFGKDFFGFYSRHHQAVSDLYGRHADAFKPVALTNHDNEFYIKGFLLRQCGENRELALYLNHYSRAEKALFRNGFTAERHVFDDRKVHSCILDSMVAGHAEDQRTLFTRKRFTGTSDAWTDLFTSRPFLQTDPAQGTLVVVNFDLNFKSKERMVRFRFINQRGSGEPFDPSFIENSSPLLPQRTKLAVCTRIVRPVGRVRLVISARGRYDVVLGNVKYFVVRKETALATNGR